MNFQPVINCPLKTVVIPTLMLIGIGVGTPRSLSQSAEVSSNKTEHSSCTFGIPTVGILLPLVAENKLSSFPSANGTPATVSLSCTQSVNLVISAPVQLSGSHFTPTACNTVVYLPLGMSYITGKNFPFCAGSGSPTPINAGSSGVLEIDMFVQGAIPSGDSQYKVTLTITPQ